MRKEAELVKNITVDEVKLLVEQEQVKVDTQASMIPFKTAWLNQINNMKKTAPL